MRALTTALILCIAWLLAGCTRPAPITPPPEIAQQTQDSQTAGPTFTPPPSATPIRTPLTPTPMQPLQETTPSPSPPPVATDDPRFGLNLAAPDYQDSFASDMTWVGPNFEGAANLWEDGHLRATDYLADTFIWWSTTIPDIEAGNVYVEVTAQPQSCSGKDSYGLAIRVDPAERNSGYILEFACDGSFRVRKLFAGSIRTLLDWRSSESIRPGGKETNTMGLLARGPRLIAFANGVMLAEIEDSSFAAGNYGLFANAADTPGFTVLFDDFRLWYLSP